ncbi:hypothetical protein [Priestia megaterium]|uniref:hypothetical protein n=1 Tax=Priestia megaterium TaxID=1404 RepID=UPI0025A3DABA|nr:hypothetical protein [Priestia megaterium]MDM8149646.1 hypothetical protein [Priestia megaterium]MED3944809.1 hypothetical protein [Priestia megaterium]
MKTGLISGIISLIIVIIISITAGNWQYIYYISGPLGILLTAIALVTLLDAFRFETRGPYFTPIRQREDTEWMKRFIIAAVPHLVASCICILFL